MKAGWEFKESFKGVPIYQRKRSCQRRGPRFQSGASCWPTLERARQYVTELEAAGLLPIHQRES
jgi:hypothetical protein